MKRVEAYLKFLWTIGEIEAKVKSLYSWNSMMINEDEVTTNAMIGRIQQNLEELRDYVAKRIEIYKLMGEEV